MIRYLILIASTLLFAIPGIAQDCSFKLSGKVIDKTTGDPLEFVNVLVSEAKTGAVTNQEGYFELTKLCHGDFHLVLSHVGCQAQKIYIHLDRDTILDLTMAHSVNVLHSIVVTGSAVVNATQVIETIGEQSISDNANENLSNLLESVAGVSTLKNGNGISKPIVHGLYGNRLTILNNGVSQSGQQWGNDHSPEIDPLVANRISVIKGTAALEYMGANLGSVILIQPRKIEMDPHIHGRANYFFESNGLSNGLNVQMHKYHPKIAWKINGTLKKSGDKKTSAYYLNNTGIEEANFALQLEKSFSKKWSADVYLSTFNSRLGVLRGSHIGNLTDLESALEQEVPFFTEPEFSYQIDAPKQQVNHHLLKAHSKFFIDDSQWFDVVAALQFNNRKEFDVRRSGLSDVPALSLQQLSFFSELKYRKVFSNQLNLKIGIQNNIIDNTNNPETGILPLIPDYLSYESGAFALLSKQIKNSLFKIGIRYDNHIQEVVTITNTTPREILRYNNTFHNVSSSGGWNYLINDDLSISMNLGLAMRNPAINELYSNGLHQGVSGIEEGSTTLKSEQSLKGTLGFKGKLGKPFTFEALAFYQRINDYIFLNPQDEVRLTIRGAFPVFIYEQTDAQIYGFDFITKLQLAKSLEAKIAYSFIKGDDLAKDLALINIPSNNVSTSLCYAFPKPIKIGEKQFENVEIEWNHHYVFEQKDLLRNQDFVAVPEGYHLFGMKLAADIQLGDNRLRLITKVDNILNVAYRDYLNRQRYFANDLGINATLGLSLKF